MEENNIPWMKWEDCVVGETLLSRGKKEDHTFLVECILKLALETEELDLERGQLEKGVDAVLEDPSKGVYFVAREDGQRVGCLMLTPGLPPISVGLDLRFSV